MAKTAEITDENQCFFDEALVCGHLAGDTHYYLTSIHPDANLLMEDAYPRFLNVQDGRSHWSHLCDLSLHLESAYETWRSRGNHSPMASLMALRCAGRSFDELVSTYAGTAAEAGLERFGPRALAVLEQRYDATRGRDILRRALWRAEAAFAGWNTNRLEELVAEHKRIEKARLADIPVIRLGDGPVWNDDDDDCSGRGLARRRIRQSVRESRKAIVRSSRLLSRLVGQDATRMFVSGRHLRVEGRHAIYEMRKISSLRHAHHGYQALAVFDRADPSLMLCKLCIQTNGVPLLDHIASLVLHIQAGMEEDILKVGNAADIQEAAYEQDWLVPFLPPKRVTREDLGPEGVRWTVVPDEELRQRELRRTRLRPAAARYLFSSVYKPHARLIRQSYEDFGRRGARIVNLREMADQLGVIECDIEECAPGEDLDIPLIRGPGEYLVAALMQG